MTLEIISLQFIVVSGVNGVGKTTTIGKMGKFFKDNFKSVVLEPPDTFRAAAIDQLELWARKKKWILSNLKLVAIPRL